MKDVPVNTKTIDRAHWKTFFDLFSQVYVNPGGESQRRAVADLSIELADGKRLRQVDHVPLIGMSYDTRSDVLDVAVERLDHLIYHPREIRVEEDEECRIRSMQILDEDGSLQRIRVEYD